MLDEINLHDAPVPVEFNDEELDTETAIVFWTSGTTGTFAQGKWLSFAFYYEYNMNIMRYGFR